MHCKEYYEKVEKDGNFCDLPESAYQELKRYLKDIKARKISSDTLTLGAWRKSRKKAAKGHKDQTKGLLRGRIASKELTPNEIDAEINEELEKTKGTRMKIYEMVGDSDDNFIRRCKLFEFDCNAAKRFLRLVDCKGIGGETPND